MVLARLWLMVSIILVLAACAGPTAAARGGGSSTGETARAADTQPKTLVIAVRYEANDLGANTVGRRPSPAIKRLFNAGLTLIDGKGQTQPYLADSMPKLNTASWTVTPDGQMETTYTLKPNLT